MRLRIARKVLKRMILNPNMFFIDRAGLFLRASKRWRKSSEQREMRRLARLCDHKHWRGCSIDGRSCSCGTLMFDPGD